MNEKCFAGVGDIIKVFTSSEDELGRFNAWNATIDQHGKVYLDQIQFLSPSPFRRSSAPNTSVTKRVTPIVTTGLELSRQHDTPRSNGSGRSLSTGVLNSAAQYSASPLASANYTSEDISKDSSDFTPVSAREEKASYARINVQYRSNSVIVNVPCTTGRNYSVITISKNIIGKLRDKLSKKFGISVSPEDIMYLVHRESSDRSVSLSTKQDYIRFNSHPSGVTSFSLRISPSSPIKY
jgi:hypothetical protein